MTSGAKNRRREDPPEPDDMRPSRYNARSETSIPRSSVAQAVSRHEQAVELREAGRFAAAERAARRALLLFQQCEGPSHPDVAHALFELGRILVARDQLRPARRCYERALAILARPRSGVGRDPDVARLRVRLLIFRGDLERVLGAHEDAERTFRLALAFTRRRFGRDDGDVAGILNNLGVLRKYQGRFAEAERFYRRALPTIERSGDVDALATLYHNLGGLEHARERYERGEPYARRSVELRESLFGADHVAVAADVAALAALVEGRGDLARAERLYERAQGIFRRVLGPSSVEMALVLSSLAAVKQKQGRIQEAEVLYRRALLLQERLFGKTHHEVAMTVNNLGFLMREKGDLAEALALYARALRDFERTLGAGHPHTQMAKANHRAVLRERASRGSRR